MDPPTESWDPCVFVDLGDLAMLVARVGGRLWCLLFGVLFHKLRDISGVPLIVSLPIQKSSKIIHTCFSILRTTMHLYHSYLCDSLCNV